MQNKSVYHFRLLIFLLFFLSPVAVYSLDMDLTTVGTAVFSTLAAIQASIFAIVFSVVILGVQLSTSQYSPRLPDLFRSDTVYLQTAKAFAISIGVSLIGLLLYGYVSDYWVELWMYISIITAIVAFGSLFSFVDKTLEQTTPEGILNRLEEELLPSQFIEQAEASNNDNSVPDPFVVILSVINSQIAERDTAAVYFGLNIISRRVGALLEECDHEELHEDTPVGGSVNQLCTNRLTNTGQRAVATELEESANKVVSTLEAIGQDSINESMNQPVLFAGRGLSDMIFDLDYNNVDERVRGESIESSKDLIQNAAENNLWAEAGKVTRYLGWQMANSVHTRNENQNHDVRYTSAVTVYFPGILEKLVESAADGIDSRTVDWDSSYPENAHDSYSESRAIKSVYVSVAELTGSFLRYEMKTGVSFCDWGDVGYGWVEAISNISDNKFDSLRKLWIGTILFLNYIKDETPEEVMYNFDPYLHREVCDEEIISTIEKILSKKSTPDQWLFFRQTIDPIDMPRTGYQYQLNIDNRKSFDEWLSNRKKVLAASKDNKNTDNIELRRWCRTRVKD